MHVCFVQWQGYSLILSTDVTKPIKSSMRWRGHVTYTRDMRNENKILSFYPDNLNERDTLGILLGQYTKLDFRERWEGYDWTHLSQDTIHWLAFVNMTMNPWVPQKAEHFVPSSGSIIISWQTLIHGVCYLIWRWINIGKHSCLYSRCYILLRIPVSAV